MDDDVYMLSTFDNPYNPHTHFDEWQAYDVAQGHCTLAYLARVVRSSDELSEADRAVALNVGIDDIVQADPFGIYLKVTADTATPVLASTTETV